MKKIFTLVLLCLATASFLTAQIPAIELKLQLLPDGESWGVFAKPKAGISPSASTITGSAQATVVMPLGFQWNNLQSHAGTWTNDATVAGPVENPGRTYTSFGLVTDFPKIQYVSGQETLLFSFKKVGDCPDTMYLIDNDTDPMANLNWGGSCDLGNEFSIIDFGTGGTPVYWYSNNYAPSAWSCHDNDGDGILNAHEDTNGNGVYDQGLDASNLNGGPFKALDLKLQLMPDGNTWGVYVKPDSFISPSLTTITGSAQVTVVMPLGYQWNSLVNHTGIWTQNATAAGPAENPGRTYTSFGLVTDLPKINYAAGQETLLFTFKGISPCPDTMYLIDNENDPFADLPNSYGSNPGNEISVLDTGTIDWKVYYYSSNYAPSAWSCHDNDGDGILNAHEDTNGNGVYDPGVDSSDLFDMEDLCVNSAFFLHPANVVTCSGEPAFFSANAGDADYQWQKSANGGNSWIILSDDGVFHGSKTDTLFITNVEGMNGNIFRAVAKIDTCQSYSNAASLKLEGPLQIITHPSDYVACASSFAIFSAKIKNPGFGPTQYRWQQSLDNGSTWLNLNPSFTPPYYGGSTSDTLLFQPSSSLDNSLYRIKAWTTTCDTITSIAATLTVEGPLEITSHPQNSTLCPDESAVFSASVTNAGAGDVIFKWEMSSNGITWSEIAEGTSTSFGGIYSGTNTDKLGISKVKGLNGRKYRLKARTGECDLIFSNGAVLQVDGSICPVKKCVQLKLEYQPAKSNWAVKLRAQPGSPVTTGNVLTSASITLVAPQNFDYQNFTSKKGVWELSGTLENPAENPGMKYLTFELQPGAASLNLGPWTETTLFTFKKMGDCPDSLYLMDGMIPQGIEPNEIKGHGQANGQTHSIQLCGVYDLAAWRCLSPAPPDDLPIDTEIMLQFVRDNKTATGQALEKQKITTTGEPARFSISPNPATDWLDVAYENNRPEANATLRLLTLQGQWLHQQNLPDTGRLRLDLTALPPGIYFLTLEADGKVVLREKLVKF